MHKLLKKAFTLIELLVVIAIIGILSGLIVVGMGDITSKARIAKSKVFNNSLKDSILANLVSEWKLDEESGSTAYDTWNQENDGTIYGTTRKQESDCISNGCLSFNGSSDWVDLGDLGIYDSATISLWFKKVTTGSSRYILDGRPNGTWWLLTYYSGYDLTFLNLVTYNGLSANTWYNLVITASSTAGTKMYLDGNLVDTGASVDPNLSTTRIGTRYTNSGYFDGLIDEVRVFNAIASSSQIKEQYYTGLNSLFAKEGATKEEYKSKIEALINTTAQR